MLLGVFLLCLAPQALSAQTWTAQTSGTSNSLRGVDFVNASTGWAVGHSGTILHTSNGGTTWSAQTSGTSQDLLSVVFASAGTGWAVGNGGTILHTSNGGTTWSAQTSGTSQDLLSVDFVDASTGWAVGVVGTILHTSNGGTTWSAQTSGISNGLYDVSFVDASTGWAVGNGGTILHTSNGGTTWSAQTSGTGSNLFGVVFVSANTGWAVGNGGTILHTSNGGATWSAQTSGTGSKLYDVAFVGASTGWAVGVVGTILHTSNGGTTWSAQTSGTSNGLEDVSFVDANTGWTVGTNGTILHTTDGSLPVELTHFEASLDGHDALLAWKTVSETNNAGFEIQRISKNDGASPLWQALGFVDGYGTTELPQSYSYRVEALEPGRHVFRLKQIDYDGTFEYHPEVEVVVEMTERFFVEPAYPNPFNPQARLRFAVQRAQAVEVGLFDLLGRQVAVLYAGVASAGQVQEVWIDGSALPSGLYVVRVQGTSFVETQIVTLLK